MLFRDSNNNLIEINKSDFITDKLYYEYIMNIKNISYKNNSLNIQQKIKNIINNK